MQFFKHLVQGAGQDAEHHRNFYDEYLAVMDITGEFYLQTVETVFQKFSLPTGKMMWKDPFTGQSHRVNPGAITTAIMTVGGSSMISPPTANPGSAAAPSPSIFRRTSNITTSRKVPVTTGSSTAPAEIQIMPRVRHFIRKMDDPSRTPIPEHDLELIPDLAAPAIRSEGAWHRGPGSSPARPTSPPTEKEKENPDSTMRRRRLIPLPDGMGGICVPHASVSAVASPVLDPYAADLAAIHPSLRMRVSARAKRLALRLDAKTGLIHLVMPKRASLKSALAFARQC